MESNQDNASFDREVRRHVYDGVMQSGMIPTASEVASIMGSTEADVKAAFRRLAEGRVLVLQENGEVLMANPFSAVPTSFLVEAGGRSYWGNCIWDSLGVPAMLNEDARITTGCGDCNDGMIVSVNNGSLAGGEGIIHFSVPAARWWDNIKFT